MCANLCFTLYHIQSFVCVDWNPCVRRNKCKCIVNNKYEYGQWSCSFKTLHQFFFHSLKCTICTFVSILCKVNFSLTAIFFGFFFSFNLLFFYLIQFPLFWKSFRKYFFMCRKHVNGSKTNLKKNRENDVIQRFGVRLLQKPKLIPMPKTDCDQSHLNWTESKLVLRRISFGSFKISKRIAKPYWLYIFLISNKVLFNFNVLNHIPHQDLRDNFRRRKKVNLDKYCKIDVCICVRFRVEKFSDRF